MQPYYYVAIISQSNYELPDVNLHPCRFCYIICQTSHYPVWCRQNTFIEWNHNVSVNRRRILEQMFNNFFINKYELKNRIFYLWLRLNSLKSMKKLLSITSDGMVWQVNFRFLFLYLKISFSWTNLFMIHTNNL